MASQTPKPGDIVDAKIKDKFAKGLYFVGVKGKKAILQGSQQYEVPLKDLKPKG